MNRDIIGNVLVALDSVHRERIRRLERLNETKEASDIFERAVTVFGSDVEAAIWFTTELAALSGEIPAEIALTDGGRVRVRTLITQIEHGVYV